MKFPSPYGVSFILILAIAMDELNAITYQVSVSLRSIVHSYSYIKLSLDNSFNSVSVSLRSIVHSYLPDSLSPIIQTFKCFRLLTEYRSFLYLFNKFIFVSS